MSLQGYQLKLKKVANQDEDMPPQFSLSYRSRSENYRKVSYEILSALAANCDLIIDVKTDLFETEDNKGRDIFQQFMDHVTSLELPMKYQKVPSMRNDTFLGFVLSNTKRAMAQELSVYIPNAVWKEQPLYRTLPDCGVNYQIIQPGIESAIESLERLWGKSPEEKAAACRMTVFDIARFGQMGITTSVEIEELLKLLGL